MYFSADPFCRRCIRGARRGFALRIAGGVAGVMLLMTVVTGVMLAAIPSHVRARIAPLPVRHVENCQPYDRWLAEARLDLEHHYPHHALHDVALSRRDCVASDSERDRIEALAYAAIGDKFGAIAAMARYADANDDDSTAQLRAAVSAKWNDSLIQPPACLGE